jgi:glycosyltransferase involved in cell wall biosynthesis
MKIAIVCPASLPATQFGGIMYLGLDMAKELSKIGHDVTIFTTDLGFANNAHTFDKNLPRVETIEKFKINRSHVWFAIQLFFVNPGMYSQMMKDNPDVIHTIGVRSFQSYVAALVAKKKKIPLILSDQGGLMTHPDLSESFLKKLLFKMQLPMIRFVINQASKISAGNEYEKKILSNFCDESKIVIIRNGINLETLKASLSFKQKYDIMGSYILFVGRFHMVKGVDILLNAINLLRDRISLGNTKFVIMGVDFGFETQMFAMIKELKIHDVVKVIKNPPREDVISAYEECEFLVLPSRWELSPLTPLEGFAFKKAVISTNIHGIPYTITDNENGLLVKSEDPDGLANAIIELLQNKEKRLKLGLAGFELVQKICNSKEMSMNTLKLYQEVVRK